MNERRSRPSRSFVPDEATISYAVSRGLDLTEELEGWLDWCDATGRLYLDHQAGFRTWLRHAVQYGRGGRSLAVPRGTPACPLGVCEGDGLVPTTYDDGTYGWVDCECRSKAGTSVRPIVQSESHSLAQKEGAPSEDSAPNLTLFTNLVEFSAPPTRSR